MKENKGRVGRPDKKKGKEKQKGVGNEKQFWRGENLSKKKKEEILISMKLATYENFPA